MEEFGDIYFFSPTLIPSEFEKEKEKKVHAEDEANFWSEHFMFSWFLSRFAEKNVAGFFAAAS